MPDVLEILNQSILALSVRNAELEESIDVLLADAVIQERKLGNLQSDYYAELGTLRKLKTSEDTLRQKQKRLSDLQDVIRTMPTLSTDEDFVSRIMDSDDPYDVLVDAIKKASLDPRSPWSKLIPTIPSPRSLHEYEVTLRIPHRLRSELKDLQKEVNVWKAAAKRNTGTDLFTPSPSKMNYDLQHSISHHLSPPVLYFSPAVRRRVEQSTPSKRSRTQHQRPGLEHRRNNLSQASFDSGIIARFPVSESPFLDMLAEHVAEHPPAFTEVLPIGPRKPQSFFRRISVSSKKSVVSMWSTFI